MTAWTGSEDIRTRLEKKWNKGEILAQCVSSLPFVPLRIPVRHPTARELTHGFEAARNWIDDLVRHAATPEKKGYVIEWRKINHRTLGRDKIPTAVIFHSLDDVLAHLGRMRQAKRYEALFRQITEPYPELTDLLMEKPLDVLAYEPVWPELLAVVAFLRKNPRPGIYIRQLEIPGVDTKFMETHKSWLEKLLIQTLPETATTRRAVGPTTFEARFGFRSRPARIRFRILDPDLSVSGLTDIEIPEQDFRNPPIRPNTLFIVENEINGLAFPPSPGAWVIFGMGYGLSALSESDWIRSRPVWYWGDLDTHGFAMLDQVRHYFPHTRSFLMDEATLLSHKSLWGREPAPTNRDLPLLTPDETRVYDALRYHRHAENLRLEQERISFTLVRRVVDGIDKAHPHSH